MSTRLRLLWVKMGGLWPTTSGGRLRSYHIINALSRHNDVTVLTTSPTEEEGLLLKDHLPFCRRVKSLQFSPPKKDSRKFLWSLAASWLTSMPVDIYKYQNHKLRHEVINELDSGNYDVCIADFLTSLPNIPRHGNTPLILFSHNVEYMIWRRLCDNEKNLIKHFLLSIEWRKMRRFELNACREAAATITVSDDDTQLLLRGNPDTRITSVPTGVDIDYFKPDPAVEMTPTAMVFTGSMDWHPNEDAMLYFIGEVWPVIRKAIPSITFSIVGRNPSERLRTAANLAGVEVTGTVADIRPWLHRAAVYVVPLRIGGGTRLKIFEALAAGKAVVSTTIGAEGLNLQDDVHLLRADNAEDFASKTVSLLLDPMRAQQLGEAGRQLMVANYAWSKIACDFEKLCRDALSPAQDHSTHQPIFKHQKESL